MTVVRTKCGALSVADCQCCGSTCNYVYVPPEPAKPERQASEIEKRAALALLKNLEGSVYVAVDSDDLSVTRSICAEFVEAYDYAKSIGAIE